MYSDISIENQGYYDNGNSARPGLATAAPLSDDLNVLLQLYTRVLDARLTMVQALADSQLLPAHAADVGATIQEAARLLDQLCPILAELITDEYHDGGR